MPAPACSGHEVRGAAEQAASRAASVGTTQEQPSSWRAGRFAHAAPRRRWWRHRRQGQRLHAWLHTLTPHHNTANLLLHLLLPPHMQPLQEPGSSAAGTWQAAPRQPTCRRRTCANAHARKPAHNEPRCSQATLQDDSGWAWVTRC